MELRPILSTLRRHKLTVWLLVLEIALTCAIVCNAVFLIGQRLQRMDMPSGIAEHELVQIQLGYIGDTPDAKAQTQTDVAALQQIPGVKQVGLDRYLPFSLDGSSNTGIKLDPQQQQNTLDAGQYLGQNLLPALGARLVAGRNFEPGDYVDFDTAVAALNGGDMKGLPQTIIITRAIAERLWPGQQALGKTLYTDSGIPFRVIGVMAVLARQNNLRQGAQYSTYWPIRMTSADGASYFIRCVPQDRESVLKAAVAKFSVPELDGGDKEKALLTSLQKGNVQAATIVANGEGQKVFLEANPQYKTVTIYDANMHRLSQEQRQELTKEQSQDQGKDQSQQKEQKQDIKKAQRQGAGDDLDVPKKKKARGQRL